jgi:hypothetical protein
MTPPLIPAGRRRSRILGIDAARALAIIGMVMVHIGPTDPTGGIAATLYGATHGRASVLFVVLAGLGVSLLAGDRSRPRMRRAWQRLAWRTLVFLPLGLWLQTLDHNVLVILQYYALYYLVAAAAAHLPDRALLLGAGVLATVGPIVYLAVWHAEPTWFAGDPTRWGDPPAVLVRQLLLTGAYPVLTWSAPLLLGVWVGRRDLRDAAVGWRLAGVGTGVAVAAWGASRLLVAWLGEPTAEPSWLLLVDDGAHSQMPLWLVGAAGSAVAVLGLSLRAAATLPHAVAWPVAMMGQLAFTIYVGHLLVLDRWPGYLERSQVGDAALSVARFTVACLVLAAVWRWLLPRGPLEALLRAPWTLQERRRERSAA